MPQADSPFSKPPAPRPPSRLDSTTTSGSTSSTARSSSAMMLTLIATMSVVVLLIVWYEFSRRQPSSTATIAATRRADSKSPASRTQVSSSDVRAMTAMNELRGLRSITQAGVTYRDYSPRVLDSKVKIDRYLDESGGSPEFKVVIREAMEMYVFASLVWNARITKTSWQVSGHPAIDLCPPLKDERDTARDRAIRESRAPEVLAGWAIENNIPMIWTCASERIKQLETLP